MVAREGNMQGVEGEVQKGGAGGSPGGVGEVQVGLCGCQRVYAYENGRDAKSFVGEDDSVVGVAERSSEIDAVIPRAHLYHAGDTPVLLRYKLHLYCITRHSTMMMMMMMMTMMTMKTMMVTAILLLLQPQWYITRILNERSKTDGSNSLFTARRQIYI